VKRKRENVIVKKIGSGKKWDEKNKNKTSCKIRRTLFFFLKLAKCLISGVCSLKTQEHREQASQIQRNFHTKNKKPKRIARRKRERER